MGSCDLFNKKDAQQKERRKEVIEQKIDWQDFHHKCIQWYITIMGFFIAGILAGIFKEDATTQEPEILKSELFIVIRILIIVASLILSWRFYQIIKEYSARIDKLNCYLNKSDPIPANWRAESRDVTPAIHGEGSKFFECIIWVVQGMLFMLIVADSIRKFF